MSKRREAEFFYVSRTQKISFCLSYFFICIVNLCGYLLDTLENLEIYGVALQYCLSLYAVLARKSDQRDQLA